MSEPSSPLRNTSLILIALTLVTGIALGWLLRDLFGDRAGQPAPAQPMPLPLPTQVVAPSAAAARPTAPVATQPAALWVAPTAIVPPAFPTTAAAPPRAPSPAATPATPEIVAYAGHTVAAGETLETIATQGGSTADLIARYNLIDGAARPGRALIVPQVAGRASTLTRQPLLVRRGQATKPWVALTLDAGASAAPVPAMLQTLREHNVKITFFLTGTWIKENPALAREIVADGHEIANHTFTHPDLRQRNDAAIRKELADTEALLAQTTGATTRPLFRPPYGAYDERVLRLAVGEGYLPIYWTLDSLDSVGEPKTADFLFERVTAKLTPAQLRGAIILAHCGSQPTADALPRILDRFAEMGFEVKKVSEVLG